MGKWIILIIALFAIFFFVLRRKHSPAMALHISAIPPPNKDAADFSAGVAGFNQIASANEDAPSFRDAIAGFFPQ